MKKKRNRKVTGRFITQKQLPKENPTLGEIAEGQRETDVRRCVKDGSPYWGYLDTQANVSGDRTDPGAAELREPVEANPDLLANDEVVPSGQVPRAVTEYGIVKEGINTVLTDKERHIMLLVIDGLSQERIARNLGVKQQSVSQHIRVARKKLEKYLADNIVE